MSETQSNTPSEEKPKLEIKDLKGVTEKIKGIDTSYLDKTRAALSSLKEGINKTIKDIRDKKREGDETAKEAAIANAINEIKIDQYAAEDPKNPLYAGFLKDMNELGITENKKINDAWKSISDDFKNYLKSVKAETVNTSPEYANLSGFVDNLEAQLPEVSKLMDEKNPLSEYKEKFQSYLKDNALFQWLVSFLGPNILAAARKEENEKGTTYSSRMYRGLAYILGIETAVKTEQPKTEEKPAEQPQDKIPDYLNGYLTTNSITTETTLSDIKTLKEAGIDLSTAETGNSVLESVKKEGNGTYKILQAVKDSLGDLPFKNNLMDIRFSNWKPEEITKMVEAINSYKGKSPEKIRQFLNVAKTASDIEVAKNQLS